MRRSTILSLTAAAALAAAPASALGHGADDHGSGHDATPVATVAAFADGTLTLTLADGSTLAAKVTDRTRLACESIPATPRRAGVRERHHGHHGGRHRYQKCSIDNLAAGTTVTGAEVSATTSGAVFREVDLAS